MVPGTEYLYGAGCAADGDCVLAGASSVGAHNFGSGVLVGDSGGALLAARSVSGTNGLGQTVCGATTGECVSAGAVFSH